MADDRNRTGTEIAEGLPEWPGRDERREPDESDIRAREPSALEVFLAWEKKRIAYNFFMCAGIFLKTSAMKGGLDGRFFLNQLLILMLMNAVFSLGPVVEGYLCWFGVFRRAARLIGLIVAIILGFSLLAISR